MLKAISKTSPLLYLYRINEFELFPKIFNTVCTTNAVALELEQGQKQSFDVPILSKFDWLKIKDPQSTPSEWLALDLGENEKIVGIEILEASKYVNLKSLLPIKYESIKMAG
ncbi:hypothetical protein JW964_11670 [candidate division KSB1 bacterium]|nr:hypothetical protein [candidate division KSB1 bacterium]